MPVPIMFAITMQVAVSSEMRRGLLGMSSSQRKIWGDTANPGPGKVTR